MGIDWKKTAVALATGIILPSMPAPIPWAADGFGGAPKSPPRESPTTGVSINGRALTPPRLQELQAMYGVVPSGRYWYDSVSGLFGLWGQEAAGFLRPGHDFGKVPANASAGDTGVFINGRQLNPLEAAYFMQVFGPAFGAISAQSTGRWWFDGTTGNVGLEGNPMPLANFLLALQQQAQQHQQGGQYGGGGYGGGGSYRWNTHSGSGGVEGRCVFANVKGAGSVMSGCD